ncbi:MAG: hypothetical protein ABJC98_07065 [Bacteroidota bacterium]
MSYSVKKHEVITYPPEELRKFVVFTYEWIDNLNFTLPAALFVSNADEYIQVAKERFLAAGWDGDGDIALMWVPPFMCRDFKMGDLSMGITMWHVKQTEDGTSFLLSPI